MGEIGQIEKMFKELEMDELPCILVTDIYNKIVNEYKTPLAGLIAVYLLGKLHGEQNH